MLCAHDTTTRKQTSHIAPLAFRLLDEHMNTIGVEVPFILIMQWGINEI